MPVKRRLPRIDNTLSAKDELALQPSIKAVIGMKLPHGRYACGTHPTPRKEGREHKIWNEDMRRGFPQPFQIQRNRFSVWSWHGLPDNQTPVPQRERSRADLAPSQEQAP